MATELITWWLVLQLFGLIGLPIAAYLFQSLPDRGYAFSKSLGLLLTGYGAWVLAMFGLGSFGIPLVLIVMPGLAVGGVLLLRHHWGIPLHFSVLVDTLRENLRTHWRGILAYELLFVVALLFVAWIRAYNPHPWGTERPMDLAFFNAIRYSASFPPPDPWLAGYSINYYYFGYLLMAIVAMFSGLEPPVAYNLSLASIFALAALGIAGIVSNLIGLTLRQQAPHRPVSPRLVAGRWLVAFVSVLMVLVIGNQAGALQVIVGDHRVVALDGRQLVSSVAQAITDPEAPIELPYPATTPGTEFGTLTTLERINTFDNFNWWWPSRVLWDAYPADHPFAVEGAATQRYNITEFPFFSFWLGDMHPHVMALPFNLLVIALALAVTTRATLPQFAAGRVGWVELLLTGVLLGSLYTINSWDLPTYMLLYVGALVLLYARLAESFPFSAATWRHLGKQVGLVALAAVLLYLPFYLTFHSLVGFAEPWTNIPILSRLSTMIAPFVAERSGLHEFLIIFGLFALPLIAFACFSAAAGDSDNTASPARNEQDEPQDEPDALPVDEQTIAQPRRAVWNEVFSPWLPALLLGVGLLIDFPLLALAGLGLVAAYHALRRAATAPAQSFVLLVIALGCAVIFGTEIIYIRDVFNTRMNTIFKFYYQIWLLWGTTSAFALWWLLYSQPTAGSGVVRVVQRAVVYGTAGLCLLLLVGGLLYPYINLQNMVQHGTWTGLEGRTPRENTPAGREATRWLRENTSPGSVVLEMVAPGGGSYNPEGYAAIAASTGRPTVLGWYGHQIQWRGGDEAARAELSPRQADVDTIYGTLDVQQALDLLHKYQVDYIYVGTLERRAYPAESLAKFDQIAQSVFQMDDVTIYKLPTDPAQQ